MIIIETERLRLEKGTLDDQEFIFTLLNSPNWVEYIGDRGIESLIDAENYIKDTLIKSYNEHGFGLYKVVLKLNNLPIGLCGILKRSHLTQPDIGYAILPEYEGYGYISEAAEATLSFAKRQLKLKTLLAITNTKNEVSQHLLGKMNFTRVINEQFKAEDEALLFETQFE
ncbi:GNAT family N-acetyltransferase [Roseivirga echinicomitans]